MAVRGSRGFVYFPLQNTFYPVWKIIVTADDGTTYYISDFTSSLSTRNYLINGTLTCPTTVGLSSANIRFANPDGIFTGKFNGGEIVQIYADYSDATTLQFRGKIDNIKYSIDGSAAFVIDITARSYPELMDVSVIGQCTTSTADIVLSDILEGDYSDIKLDFWNGTAWARATFNSALRTISWSEVVTTFPTTRITMSWQNKKGWQIISEICERAGLDCYLYYDTTASTYVLRTFIKNAVKNNALSVTYGQSLISCTDFGPDNTEVYNAVTVYGKQESDNIILLASKEDSSSIASLWKRQLIINDSSLTTMDEVREKASFEVESRKTPTITGTLRAIGLHSLLPGQQIMIYIPYMNVSGYHTVASYTHEIGLNGFVTSIQITKLYNLVSQILKTKLDIEEASRPYINLNSMKDSINIYFDENPSVVNHSGTEEVEGKLQLQSDQTTGYVETKEYLMDYNVTECEFRKYSNFPTDQNDVYEVSNDGGVTYETIVLDGTVHQFTSTGRRVKLKITLNRASVDDVSPSYESVVLLVR